MKIDVYKNKMEQNIKICADGFVWLIVSSEQARKIFKEDILTLYILYDDESEGVIENEERLEDAIARGCQIGIEVGFISEMISS